MRRLLALMLLAAGSPALAQYTDEQTRDYEKQDEAYYRQYKERAESGEADEQANATPEELRDKFLERADGLIRDRNHRSKQTEHFRLQSDDPRIDLEETVLLLERFRTFFEAAWAGRLELEPYEERSRIFLYYSFYKYNQLLSGDWSLRYARPSGHYRSDLDVIALHSDVGGPGSLADTLVHEVAHQWIDHRIYGQSFVPSRWVSEGLASYFGHTLQDKNGEFRGGRIGGKTDVPIRGVRRAPGTGAKARLAGLREELRSRRGGRRLSGVVFIDDPAEFYGRARWNYAASWVLVHFLLHGEDGRHAPAFARYMQREADGEGGAEAFFAELGLGSEQLDEALRAHLKHMRVR